MQKGKEGERIKVAVYARVSTSKQEESLEEQIETLKEYCARNNYDIYNIYAETISGAKRTREEFDKLMRDVESKKFDAVVVLKLDRFSRSMLNLLDSMEKLKEHNVDFISVIDNMETTTAQGRLIFQIMGALSEFERTLIEARTKIGIERAKREGRICHRPRINVNMKRVKERLEQNIPLTEIAAVEKVSYGTLRNRLKEAGIKVKRKVVEYE